MGRNHRNIETVMECIEALHATGHGQLAEELEDLFRENIYTYNKILGYIKKTLYSLIVVGGTLVTIGGFAWMVLQGDHFGALLFLALGLAILTVTGLMVALFTAVQEHFDEDFHETRIETMSMIDRMEKMETESEKSGVREVYDR